MEMSENYQYKYLKYKKKYLELKQFGAGKKKVYFFNKKQLEDLGITEISIRKNKDLLKNINNYLKKSEITGVVMYENTKEFTLTLSVSDKLKNIKEDVKKNVTNVTEGIKKGVTNVTEGIEDIALSARETARDLKRSVSKTMQDIKSSISNKLDESKISSVISTYENSSNNVKNKIREKICIQEGGVYKYKLAKQLKFNKGLDKELIIDDSLYFFTEINNILKQQNKSGLDSYLILEEKTVSSDIILGMSFGEYKLE